MLFNIALRSFSESLLLEGGRTEKSFGGLELRSDAWRPGLTNDCDSNRSRKEDVPVAEPGVATESPREYDCGGAYVEGAVELVGGCICGASYAAVESPRADRRDESVA